MRPREAQCNSKQRCNVKCATNHIFDGVRKIVIRLYQRKGKGIGALALHHLAAFAPVLPDVAPPEARGFTILKVSTTTPSPTSSMFPLVPDRNRLPKLSLFAF